MYLTFLIISIVLNMVLVWYIREYIKRVTKWWESLQIFRERVIEYKLLIEKVYGMDIYYGEPVIQSLVEQTGNMINAYEDLNSLINEITGDE
jgi:hypothetical protein|tara:strand:- start:90 stop:365 length:276 start_codon:yes stop_codon:yes gene_type:complete